jgi:hypothetical protein
MAMKHYTLIGQTVVPEPDYLKWAEVFATTDRIVAQEWAGYFFVSTVFLGLDHNFSRKGPPLLFETMTFLDEHSVDCYRCSTWSEAEAQHRRVVERAIERSSQMEPPQKKYGPEKSDPLGRINNGNR